jgi:rRNA-processing protein FCF1
MRLRLVIDTNIFLEKLPPGCTRVCDVWDKFEREHAAHAKVLITQVVFEEIDRKRRHHDGDISSQARGMMRYLDAKFTSSSAQGGHGFWELQVGAVCVCLCVCSSIL